MKIVKLSWIAVLGFITFVTTMILQISELALSTESLGLTLKLYALEIVVFFIMSFLFVLLFKSQKKSLKNFSMVYKDGQRREKILLSLGLAVFLLVVAGLVGTSVYQGRKLILGNIIEYRTAHYYYLSTAKKFFDQGEFEKSIIVLEECYDAITRDICDQLSFELKERIDLIRKIELFIDHNAVGMRERIDLYSELSNLLKDSKKFDLLVSDIQSNSEKSFLIYLNALKSLEAGNLEKAINKLDELNEFWNDFGHNRFLAAEIRRYISQGEVDFTSDFEESMPKNREFPFLAAFLNYGHKEFAFITAKSSLRFLKRYLSLDFDMIAVD